MFLESSSWAASRFPFPSFVLYPMISPYDCTIPQCVVSASRLASLSFPHRRCFLFLTRRCLPGSTLARSLARSLTATQQRAEAEEEKNAVFSSGENAANVAEDPGCRFLLDANNSTRDGNDDFFFFFYPRHRDLSPIIAPAARSFGVVARTRQQ